MHAERNPSGYYKACIHYLTKHTSLSALHTKTNHNLPPANINHVSWHSIVHSCCLSFKSRIQIHSTISICCVHMTFACRQCRQTDPSAGLVHGSPASLLKLTCSTQWFRDWLAYDQNSQYCWWTHQGLQILGQFPPGLSPTLQSHDQ